MTTLDDLPELQQIAVATQVDTFGAFNSKQNMDAFLQEAYDLDKLRRELLEPGSMNYVAYFDDALAGFSRLRKSKEVEHLLGTNAIELQRIYVLKQYHGNGIGAALMKRALEYAGKAKFEWMWLGVWERNFKAQEFYARFGFARFSEHIFQMGDDAQTDWLLRRSV